MSRPTVLCHQILVYNNTDYFASPTTSRTETNSLPWTHFAKGVATGSGLDHFHSYRIVMFRQGMASAMPKKSWPTGPALAAEGQSSGAEALSSWAACSGTIQVVP